jgi:hypothetical protein
MDMNTLVWVSPTEFLGGARFGMSATLPIASNSLTSDIAGTLNAGGGLADSYYQPFILGWQKKWIDFRLIYGFLASTGRFSAGAANNVGSGYWTQTAAAGQTFYLTSGNRTAVPVFEMYEFHGMQEGSKIHPGDTIDLDYSITRTFRLGDQLHLQMGLAGYGQYQTTDKRGPSVTPTLAADRYVVDALGAAANLVLLKSQANVGIKYFKEFSTRLTFQGYSVQITAAIHL